MKRWLFFLRAAAVLTLLVCAAASLYGYALQTQSGWEYFNYHNRTDEISLWESRMAPIKAKIPAGVTRVGYVTEDVQYNEYYLTQYALIPLVLERSQSPEWLVANDSGRNVLRLLNGETSAYEIESFGFGLYLIHRK
jgi:hypothetical protein